MKHDDKIFLLNVEDFSILEGVVFSLEENKRVWVTKEISFDDKYVLLLCDFEREYPDTNFIHKSRYYSKETSYMLFSTKEKAEQFLKNKIAPFVKNKIKEQSDYFFQCYMECVEKNELLEKACNAIKLKIV